MDHPRNSQVEPTKVVAVMSGGLDSTVMGYLLRRQGHDLHALSFDYGQSHRKELTFAQATAVDLGVPWDLVDLRPTGFTRFLGASALTDPGVPIPDGHYAHETMRATIVANRNAIMLAMACTVAASVGAGAVAFAAHSGDHPIYPDCRPEFVQAFQAMEDLAMEGTARLLILAPFARITKIGIVELGHQLGVPFERTWSCYKGREVHCGRCGTCYERREAFGLAGITDPTVYASPFVTLAP